MIELPIRARVEASRFEIELDGAVYLFRFLWNARAESWSATIAHASGAPIVSGVRVCADSAIFDSSVDGLPPGDFVVVDNGGEGVDPGRLDLGDRVRILYFPAGE